MMKRRELGRTGLSVTEVSFGASGLGNLYREVSEEVSIEVLDAAWDAGIRYFDTAPFYGFGLSEKRLGDYLQSKPRSEYVLSTKVGRLLRPVPEDKIPDHGFVNALAFEPYYDYSYDGILRSVDASLQRLGVGRIDMLYVHDIGKYTHEDAHGMHLQTLYGGGLKALAELRASGVIRGFGLGVNEVEVCLEVMGETDLDAILLANRYTLLDRSATDLLIPVCEARAVSLVVGGVFNSGILATGIVPGAHYEYGEPPVEIVRRVQALQETAEEGGTSLAAAALQFPLNSPVVASVLIGTARVSNLSRNLALMREVINPLVWTKLEAYG